MSEGFFFGQSLSPSFFPHLSLSLSCLSLCVCGFSYLQYIISQWGSLHYGLTVGICTMMEEDKYSTKLYGMVRVVRMVGIRSGFGIFNTGLGGM